MIAHSILIEPTRNMPVRIQKALDLLLLCAFATTCQREGPENDLLDVIHIPNHCYTRLLIGA